MLRRIIILAQEVKMLEGCSVSTAYERIKLARIALAKKPHQKLTILEFCEYYGYDWNLVSNMLIPSK